MQAHSDDLVLLADCARKSDELCVIQYKRFFMSFQSSMHDVGSIAAPTCWEECMLSFLELQGVTRSDRRRGMYNRRAGTLQMVYAI